MLIKWFVTTGCSQVVDLIVSRCASAVRGPEVPRVLFLGVCLDFYYFLARVALAKF